MTISWHRWWTTWPGKMVYWHCYSEASRTCLVMGQSRVALIAVTMRLWGLKCSQEWPRQIITILHFKRIWSDQGLRTSGPSPRTASSEHKRGPLQCAESQSSRAEGQHGWTGNIWISSRAKIKLKQRQGGSEDRLPRKNTKALPKHERMLLGKVELSCSWNKLEKWRAIRTFSVGILEAKGRLREVEVHTSVKQEI